MTLTPAVMGAQSCEHAQVVYSAQLSEPATFHAIKRNWRNGDYAEVEFDMPLRMETIDMKVTAPLPAEPGVLVATPGVAQFGALMSGPVVFMATGAWPIEMRKKDLMAAKQVSNGDAYSVPSNKDPVLFKPFTAIQDELYRTYQPLKTEG